MSYKFIKNGSKVKVKEHIYQCVKKKPGIFNDPFQIRDNLNNFANIVSPKTKQQRFVSIERKLTLKTFSFRRRLLLF